MEKPGVYLGSRLRHLRRERGLTQAQMAGDLDVSPSYIALMERNQRPITADMLLRLAHVYQADFSRFSSSIGSEIINHLRAVLRDPLFKDLDVDSLEIAEVARSFPSLSEALIRLHIAYLKEASTWASTEGVEDQNQWSLTTSPALAVQNFITENRNFFRQLDEAAERLAAKIVMAGSIQNYFKIRHNLDVKRAPSPTSGSEYQIVAGEQAIAVCDTLDPANLAFSLARHLASLEAEDVIQSTLSRAKLQDIDALRQGHRALSGYFAAAVIMPYREFYAAAEEKQYDIEALCAKFGTSFEQTARRITTLQKPGQEGVVFFLTQIDKAGNVCQAINHDIFPILQHGGRCSLWNIHDVFTRPENIFTQRLDLDGQQQFFSIARTVSRGGGAYGQVRLTRALALVCDAKDTEKLIYSRQPSDKQALTAIGVCCRLCHRYECTARV
ncbi:hypothetical protein FB480_106125 [Agrobacterium vitis]|nr:hypothetical protein FB480_106125 [Agrobacterium vitis]